jgi:hypothetical protein
LLVAAVAAAVQTPLDRVAVALVDTAPRQVCLSLREQLTLSLLVQAVMAASETLLMAIMVQTLLLIL